MLTPVRAFKLTSNIFLKKKQVIAFDPHSKILKLFVNSEVRGGMKVKYFLKTRGAVDVKKGFA